VGAADHAVLNRALGRLLPGPDETHLIRAILHRGEAAHRSWDAFRASVHDLPRLFRTDTGNRKRLSPLLLTSIRENGLDADARLGTVVKTATLREELRVGIVRELAGAAWSALADAAVPFVVVRGGALMESVYAEPAHRHAHDLDVVVPREQIPTAVEAVRAVGFGDARTLPWEQGREVRHRTELPIQFVQRAFRLPFYDADFGSLSERAVRGTLAGVEGVRRPNATDALLLALGRASYCPSRSNLVWAVDAWMLLHGGEGVDWEALVVRARDMRLELPVAVFLDYLRTELEAPVPPRVPEDLRAAVPRARGLRRDVALFGARQTQGAHPELARRERPPLRERWTLLLWELLPSREYLSWAYGNPPRALLPLIYLARPFSALAERARWAVWRRLRRLSTRDA
jgi:hypothetical protein